MPLDLAVALIKGTQFDGVSSAFASQVSNKRKVEVKKFSPGTKGIHTHVPLFTSSCIHLLCFPIHTTVTHTSQSRSPEWDQRCY